MKRNNQEKRSRLRRCALALCGVSVLAVGMPQICVSATELETATTQDNGAGYRFIDPNLTPTTTENQSTDTTNSTTTTENSAGSQTGNDSTGMQTNGTGSGSTNTDGATTQNGQSGSADGSSSNGALTNGTTTNGTTTNGTTTNGTTNGTTTNGTDTNGTATNGTLQDGALVNNNPSGGLVYYDDPSSYLTQEQEEAIANSGGKDTSYSTEGTTILTGSDSSYIFIGDSRTVGMNIYVDKNKYIWSAKSGAGLTWMKKTGVPAIEGDIEDGSSIVILMGVNDVFHLSQTDEYADYLNEKAEKWVKKGANVYFVSVNPITTSSVAGGEITNAKIEKWNDSLKKKLSDNVTYIDTYSQLKGKLHAGDGLHYYADDCQKLYDTILSSIEEGDVVIEDESSELKKFKPQITSVKRNNEEEEINIVVSKPEDIKNVYYDVQFYSKKKGEWVDAGVTKKTKITLETSSPNEVMLRVNAYKNYDGKKVSSEWSNKVTVEADGTVEAVEEDTGLLSKLVGWFKGLFS